MGLVVLKPPFAGVDPFLWEAGACVLFLFVDFNRSIDTFTMFANVLALQTSGYCLSGKFLDKRIFFWNLKLCNFSISLNLISAGVKFDFEEAIREAAHFCHSFSSYFVSIPLFLSNMGLVIFQLLEQTI